MKFLIIYNKYETNVYYKKSLFRKWIIKVVFNNFREFKNHERKLQHVHSVYTQNTHENTSSQVKEIHLKNHR